MNKLQLLVATMHQKDFSLAEKMNIQCDAVFANQADTNEFLTKTMPYGNLTMITTATRGVGLNRNIALLAARGDIILFADDDVRYYDGVATQVIDAFEANPDTDVMIFSIDILKNGEIVEKRHLRQKKVHVWNSMRYGTYVIAARRSAIVQHNITFHQCFGGGCIYSSGEDSLFLKACFDAGLSVSSSEVVLGTCCKDRSSWFTGCNEKYFYDKGVLMGYLFPRLKYPMALYFALRCKKETDLGPGMRVRLMLKGLHNSRTLIPFSTEVLG